MINIYYYNLPSTCLKIIVKEGKLTGIEFVQNYWQNRKNSEIDNVFLEQINEYFGKKRQKFDLPIKFESGTLFQKKVWKYLIKIPYGKTISYGQLAEKTGDKRKTRATAAACANNPIPIIVPCHRVITADGGLGGYLGGVKMKEWLLDHEKE